VALSPLFLDTAYVHGLLNTRDQHHALALEWESRLTRDTRRLVTTEYVLFEIGDALSTIRFRNQGVLVIDALRNSPFVEVVPATSSLLEKALALYRSRPDKDWGLTDCASFVVMTEKGLVEALTSDDHFRQAGFRPLLVEEVDGSGGQG
jgi:uncharacterized protein